MQQGAPGERAFNDAFAAWDDQEYLSCRQTLACATTASFAPEASGDSFFAILANRHLRCSQAGDVRCVENGLQTALNSNTPSLSEAERLFAVFATTLQHSYLFGLLMAGA